MTFQQELYTCCLSHVQAHGCLQSQEAGSVMFLAVGAGWKRLTTRLKRTTMRMRSTTRVTCKVELCGRILLRSKEKLVWPCCEASASCSFHTSSLLLLLLHLRCHQYSDTRVKRPGILRISVSWMVATLWQRTVKSKLSTSLPKIIEVLLISR